jgi:hypothetical protein
MHSPPGAVPANAWQRESFPDPKVGELYNASFICLKIDMEKPENAEFAGKYPVSSYPTLFFIDADGKIVLKEVGAKTPDQLIETGRKAQGKNDKSGDFEKKYKEGNRDPEMLYGLRARTQRRRQISSLKITNEYLTYPGQDLTHRVQISALSWRARWMPTAAYSTCSRST